MPQANRKPCPECGKRFVNVHAHWQAKHHKLPWPSAAQASDAEILVKSAPAPEPEPVSGSGLVEEPAIAPTSCPLCEQEVTDIAPHLQEEHRNSLIECQGCGNEVKVSNIPRHLKRCRRHRLGGGPKPALRHRAVRKQTAKPRPKKGQAKTRSGTGSVRGNKGAEVDSQDATRGYRDFARDHGRFGSHPSHDDFGDESAP
jgi:hypothetical protein